MNVVNLATEDLVCHLIVLITKVSDRYNIDSLGCNQNIFKFRTTLK